MLKKICLFAALLLSMNVGAQSLNDRWVGTWQAGKDKLTIKSNVFQGCRWVGAAPKGNFKGCVAYYQGSVTKKALLDLVASDTAMLNEIAKNKQATPKEIAGYRAQIQAVKSTFDGVSEDSFRTISTAQGDYEGSGDCGTFYFLDKENVYGVSNCEGPGVPSLTATKYQKN
jgi:hypothetical protein